MSSNKKFRIQNGAAITGEVTVNDQVVITEAGIVTVPAISAAVATIVASDIATLQSQVDAILGTSPESLNTLQEIVSLFQSEDGDIQTLITNNSTAITAMQATLSSGVAGAADFAALDTFVKGSESTIDQDGLSENTWNTLGLSTSIVSGTKLAVYGEHTMYTKLLDAGEYTFTYAGGLLNSTSCIIRVTAFDSSWNPNSGATMYAQRWNDSITAGENVSGVFTIQLYNRLNGTYSFTLPAGGGRLAIHPEDATGFLTNLVLVKNVAAPTLETTSTTIIEGINELHTEIGAETAARTAAIAAIPATDLTPYSTTAQMDSSIATAKSEAQTYADQVVASTIDAAPAALDTLNELAAALGDDANFASTVTASIATKATAADLTALEAQITGGVATLAQGALADTALQPADLVANTTAIATNASNLTALETSHSADLVNLTARTYGVTYDPNAANVEVDSTLDMQTNAIINVAAPSAADDAATKAYVDAGQVAAISASAAALSGGLCITYDPATGEIKIDTAETASSLLVADSNNLGSQAPSHYRIDVYNVNGTIVN